MNETHINAFYADVETAKQKVQAAQAELQGAEQRLADKKKQTGHVEPSSAPAVTEQDPTVTATVQSNKKK